MTIIELPPNMSCHMRSLLTSSCCHVEGELSPNDLKWKLGYLYGILNCTCALSLIVPALRLLLQISFLKVLLGQISNPICIHPGFDIDQKLADLHTGEFAELSSRTLKLKTFQVAKAVNRGGDNVHTSSEVVSVSQKLHRYQWPQTQPLTINLQG